MAARAKGRKCPYCGEKVTAKAINCKHCGADLAEVPETLNQAVPDRRNGLILLLAVVVGLAVAGMVIFMMMSR